MRNLGKIRLLLLNDKYSVQFSYSTPRKIDFFELVLMEIIKHSGNFNGQTIEQILLMLEIPDNFHFFFERRLKELIVKSPEIIKYEKALVMREISEDTGLAVSEPRIVLPDNSEILTSEVSLFSLTQLGEDAFASKEIVEDPKTVSNEYLYKSITNELIKIPENTQDENASFVLDMCTLDQSAVEATFAKIITANPGKFISDVSDETKIFELTAAYTGTACLTDNITVSTDNGKIKFSNNNEKILKAFLNAPPQEKQQLKEKQIFNHINTPQTKVNFDRAKIAAKKQNPVKMKVVFGEAESINAIVEAEREFPINSGDLKKLRKEHNFCFAGITASGSPLVFNYQEITEAGYTIPLEDEDNSAQNYNAIFKSAYNYIRQIEFAIFAALKDQKDFVFKVIKDELSKGNLNPEKVIEIMKVFDLPKENIIKILADNTPKTNDIINALLAIDESITIRIYEIKKMYNSLLKTGRLSDISHNTNIFANFVNYDKQYKKLQTMGLKNYYEYDIPKDWAVFINEVNILRDNFAKIRDHLEDDALKKQAADFFKRIFEDYDALPIDNSAIKKVLNEDLLKEITGSKYDIVMIAGAIRYKYDEYFHSMEKKMDPKSNGSRKGRALIQYVFKSNTKLIPDASKHWKNLCVLIHEATEKNNPLWKGSDKDRQKILKEALDFYNKNLIIKEEKNEPSDKGAV